MIVKELKISINGVDYSISAVDDDYYGLSLKLEALPNIEHVMAMESVRSEFRMEFENEKRKEEEE